MPGKRHSAKRSAEHRSGPGNGVVWYLIAAGVASLFALSLVSTAPHLELTYSDLERLISAANASGPERWIDRKSTRLNSSHVSESRMPSSA